jgi:alanine dehydrogenase
MMHHIGIRREDKNKWEQRTPIIPKHVKDLLDEHQIKTYIQPSTIRSFKDEEYEKAGAVITEDLSSSGVIFAVKEIPKEFFEIQKTYVFFAHVIKGQKYNMPMLKEMMKKKCTLIDYEKIVNEKNMRLIFFGKYAGIAGMVDTLYSFGQRMKEYYSYKTPFLKIKKTFQYSDLSSLKEHISEIGTIITSKGIPQENTPFIIGFAGYGNVSKGAQEIINLLPCIDIEPNQIDEIMQNPSNKHVYKVVFKEKDMVQPIEDDERFQLQDYYAHPEKYKSIFEKYLPNLTILMNCIYWDERYPRLLTKNYLKEHFEDDDFKLLIVGDISIDINGAIEPTGKVTTPDNPFFVYNPDKDEMFDDISHKGLVIMGVDNLPCELPKDSSTEFSNTLYQFIPSIVNADYSASFEELTLPPEIKNAVILHKGKLTPSFTYINNYL